MSDFFDWYKEQIKDWKFTPEMYDNEIQRLQARLDWYDREIAVHLEVTPEFMRKRNSVATELDKLLQAKERAKDNE